VLAAGSSRVGSRLVTPSDRRSLFSNASATTTQSRRLFASAAVYV